MTLAATTDRRADATTAGDLITRSDPIDGHQHEWGHRDAIETFCQSLRSNFIKLYGGDVKLTVRGAA
jgi:hypothetical protein